MENAQLRDRILNATLQVFNEKGLKFTMDDITALLGISKKTIYTVFEDKNSLITQMVDYCFDSIKESEQMVLKDHSLGIVEKIQGILGVLPEGYKELNLEQLYQLRDKYPEVYMRVQDHLESGWENTIALIEEGIQQKKIRKVNITILKTMMEATLEQFFQRDVLVRNEISYQEALDEVVTILMQGIILK